MIFGRAGEEIESLRRAGVPYEIVPGVTSALGAAAAAEIPLTHRRMSSAVVFLTAHQASGSEAADWSRLGVERLDPGDLHAGQELLRRCSAKLRAARLSG